MSWEILVSGMKPGRVVVSRPPWFCLGSQGGLSFRYFHDCSDFDLSYVGGASTCITGDASDFRVHHDFERWKRCRSAVYRGALASQS